MNRKPIFDAVRTMLGRRFTTSEIETLDRAINAAGGALLPPVAAEPLRAVNVAGIKLMHEFEGLKLKAYPDPGSRDGKPWTVGRGSTGPDIGPGTVWTEAQADARFAQDLQKFALGVNELIGSAPTTDNQFSAMCSLAYNIGLGGFKESTLLRLHKEGDYAGAAAQFQRWNKNDGKEMAGLTRRRAAEATLYRRADG